MGINPIGVKAWVQRMLIKYPYDLLILAPLINAFLFLVLVTVHWITGSFGYVIGLTLSATGALLVYIDWVWLKSLWPRKWVILAFFWSAILLILAWYDIRFLVVAIMNNGFYPCTSAAGCP